MISLLSIAGSDPSGGAGIQQDLKVFTALGAYGCAVVTALTAQNTLGVHGVLPIDPSFVSAQLVAVLDDITLGAVKVGMLANSEIVATVAKDLEAYSRHGIIVVDPVMISKNGRPLLDDAGVDEAVRSLFPLAHVLTPNIPEAEHLLRKKIRDTREMEAASLELLAFISRKRDPLKSRGVILKGGHLEGRAPVDVLACDHGVFQLAGERVETPNTHGTGCAFSSALAVFLAAGDPIPKAVRKAKTFVAEAIRHACAIGLGIGSVNPAALITPWEAL